MGCQQWCCLSWQPCQGTQTLQLFSQNVFPESGLWGWHFHLSSHFCCVLVIPRVSACVGKDFLGSGLTNSRSRSQCGSVPDSLSDPWRKNRCFHDKNPCDSKEISLRAQRWCTGSALCSVQGAEALGLVLELEWVVCEHWAAVQAAQLCWQAFFNCGV